MDGVGLALLTKIQLVTLQIGTSSVATFTPIIIPPIRTACGLLFGSANVTICLNDAPKRTSKLFGVTASPVTVTTREIKGLSSTTASKMALTVDTF